MVILVVSRISIPAKDRTIPAWEHLRKLGHTIIVEHPNSPKVNRTPDAIIGMGVTIMEETFAAMKRFPGVPVFLMNWDVYKWLWQEGKEGTVQARHESRKNEYDYVKYGELLSLAKEIWVPSKCTGLRTQQWYGLTNWHTILSSIPYWEYPNVRDDGYAYCALREIPDPHWSWFKDACDELGIPYRMTEHSVSYEEYQKTLACCSFIVSHCYELSTGGLSLLEGYYLGKTCVLSDSKWHGGRDYLGDRAIYFNGDSYTNFKETLKACWFNKRRKMALDHRDWVPWKYSDESMVTKMMERIEHHGK